jgi:hypothetical protein
LCDAVTQIPAALKGAAFELFVVVRENAATQLAMNPHRNAIKSNFA